MTRSAGLLVFSRELLVLWMEARGCHKVSCHQESEACLAYSICTQAKAGAQVGSCIHVRDGLSHSVETSDVIVGWLRARGMGENRAVAQAGTGN